MKRNPTELYETMRRAIAFMRSHGHERLSPADVASAVGMRPAHFSRAFSAWVGLPPKRFLSHLSHERATHLLRGAADVLTAAHRSGLSSPGRLHALLVNHDGVSPGEYKHGHIKIRWGVHPSPFGHCLIGTTKRGICKISFLDGDSERAARAAITESWPNATLVRDDKTTGKLAARIFARANKAQPLVVRGTNFQIQVWKALLAIPEGKAATYADIARAIGRPKAGRAVGTACGKNPIGYLIPCHRVLTSQGEAGGYKWGPERKEAILAWEQART